MGRSPRVRVDRTLYARLEQIAQETGAAVPDLVRAALERGLQDLNEGCAA